MRMASQNNFFVVDCAVRDEKRIEDNIRTKNITEDRELTEKKKIIVWVAVVVLLIGAILFVLSGGKKEKETTPESGLSGVETELQQNNEMLAGGDAAEVTQEPVGEQITEPTPEPTQEPEVTQGVIELPFIPVE